MDYDGKTLKKYVHKIFQKLKIESGLRQKRTCAISMNENMSNRGDIDTSIWETEEGRKESGCGGNILRIANGYLVEKKD